MNNTEKLEYLACLVNILAGVPLNYNATYEEQELRKTTMIKIRDLLNSIYI